MPIRLLEPDTDPDPAMSSAGAPLPVPSVFSATIVLSSAVAKASDVQPAAIIVGDCAVDGRQRAPVFVNAATDVVIRVGSSLPRWYY